MRHGRGVSACRRRVHCRRDFEQRFSARRMAEGFVRCYEGLRFGRDTGQASPWSQVA